MNRTRALLPMLVLCATAVVVTWVGAESFRFMTDDAYIAFRYASNAHLGLGYVWNPAPFRPVEGYTSFLWVVLLDGIWRIAGIEPPDAVGTLTLLSSLGTLAVTGRLAWQVLESAGARASRPWLVGLAVLGTATNRTFLTWTSSGLETALFNLLLHGWVLLGITWRPHRTAHALGWTTLASLLALTRPDGWLFLAVTGALVAPTLIRSQGSAATRSRVLVALPMVAPALHLLWRRSFYGTWLPNAFYAKVPGFWPSAGLRYLGSFVLEYGLWFVAAAITWTLWRTRRDWIARMAEPQRWPPTIWVVGAVLAHGGFYVLVVGGDHFEYRVLSQWVPLAWVALVWTTARLELSTVQSVSLLLTAALMAAPVPWSHWAATRHLDTREQTVMMTVPIAPRWPAALRWYARAFDDLQAWLIARYIGCRHQEHKVNLQFIRKIVPPRARGKLIRDDGSYPVMVFPAVGYLAWSLPYVNILDAHGLNDYVVARLPLRKDHIRHMAHDRLAPQAYVACFRPNVFLTGDGDVRISQRRRPLTADDIVACERRWTARIVSSSTHEP